MTDAKRRSSRSMRWNMFMLLTITVPFLGITLEKVNAQRTLETVEVHQVIPAEGSKPWSRHTIDNTSRGADGVRLGDIDSDGDWDLVTGWEEGGEVRVYRNPGPSLSKQPWPRVTVGHVKDPEDAFFVDIDGDGRLEVVSCTEGKTKSVYLHRWSGDSDDFLKADRWTTILFDATRERQMWMQGFAIDVDGRNGIDLVLGSKNQDAKVGWLESARSDHASSLPIVPLESGSKYHALRDAGWIMSIAPHDFDRDGDIDIFFSDRKGSRRGLFWLENPGVEANRRGGAWKEHELVAIDREVMFADIVDIDGNGWKDVAVAVKPTEIEFALADQDSSWKRRRLVLDSKQIGDAKSVRGGDLNGDGRIDLAFSCENAHGDREGVVWLEQEPQGTWKQHSLAGPEGVKFDLIQLIDLDRDGDLDVVTCEERDQLGVIWYENPQRGVNP